MATSSKPRSPRAKTIRTAALVGGGILLVFGLLASCSTHSRLGPTANGGEAFGRIIGMLAVMLILAAVGAGIGALIGLTIASIRGDSRDVPDPAAVPAGWYPDPADLPQHRFWDGTVWTEHTAPAGAPAPTSAPEPSRVTAAGRSPRRSGPGSSSVPH